MYIVLQDINNIEKQLMLDYVENFKILNNFYIHIYYIFLRGEDQKIVNMKNLTSEYCSKILFENKINLEFFYILDSERLLLLLFLQ